MPQLETRPVGPAVPSLLAELARNGIKLRLAGDDQLVVSAPKGSLTAALRERITQQKPEIIEWLAGVSADSAEEPALPQIVPDPDNLLEPFPLSDLQMSFYIGSREGLEYHVCPHQYMEFELEHFKEERFQKALNQAITRQRANIVVVNSDLMLQVVPDPEPVALKVSDFRRLPAAEAEQQMEKIRTVMQRREPILHHWPWFDLHISRYGTDRARLHFNNNNFFVDAFAVGRLTRSILHYYESPDQPLPVPQVSYRDCVLALAALEESPRGQASKKYWCDRLAAMPGAPEVPLLTNPEARKRSWLERREMVLPAQLWASIKDKASTRGLTPTNAFNGVYAEVLSYWSGSRHFLINNMITHRMPLHPHMSEVMGNFASLYPLEVDWRHDEPFTDRARRLQAQVSADMRHMFWSGVKVLQRLNQTRRTPGRAPCPFAIGSALFAGPSERPPYSMLETSQVVLDCELWDQLDGSLWVSWDVIEAMYPSGLVDAMFDGLRLMLTQLATDDAAWQRSAFDLLPAPDRRLRSVLNKPAPPAPAGLLNGPLAGQAARSGSKPAVIADGESLSYAGLELGSKRVARQLRALGVRSGDKVAILLPKGSGQIVAVLGALGAGACYVPMDPSWPQDRLRYLLRDTAAAAILTNDALSGSLDTVTDMPVLIVDVSASDQAAQPDSEVETQAVLSPDDLAYVIYTSGSTGKPKGVMLSHRGPVNTITDINRRFDVTSADVLFGVSSLCFDLSVYDVFGAIEAGATLVLPDPNQAEPASWIETVRAEHVTVWNSVPAIMELFTEAAIAAGALLPDLRLVLLSGDWIPVPLQLRIKQIAPNARVVSLGGATEASIWSICYPIDHCDPEWVSIPYGKPLANQSWHVLDTMVRDAPTWVPGELYIGGIGLAQGYLNDPAKTTAAFITHPQTGERLYRTGDLGRYLPSGDIEFLGRADFQVKIQGFRVEPGEIEHVLLEYPGIRQATVVARTAGSGKQLAAFIVPDTPERRCDLSAVRAFLAQRLPGYMIPGHITVLDNLPLTANGKLDRTALDALGPAGTGRQREYAAARTPTEATLTDIWEEVLSHRPVGVHDDFFELGGQSFAALRVSIGIQQRLGRRVPLGVMLEHRTPAQLAQWLERPESAWSPLVRLKEAADRPWFFVHPAGGNVLCYSELAGLLNDGFYAFQAPGTGGDREPHSTAEKLVAEYLPALLEVQPHGPYRLGGWSSGAVIALELTRQLELRGEPVEQLVVIDSPAPLTQQSVVDVDEATLLLWFIEDLAVGFDAAQVSTAARGRLAAAPESARLDMALELAREQTAGATELEAASLSAALRVFSGVVRACHGYRPSVVNADITVIRALDGRVTEFAGHPAATAADWGWSELTSGTVSAAAVPGKHHTLLTSGRVDAVADVITRWEDTSHAAGSTRRAVPARH